MIQKRITRILAAGVTVTAVLALIVTGAGTASAATISASTSHVVVSHVVASQAKRTVVTPDTLVTVGPVQAFSTEEQCLLLGAVEFPPGSEYLGGVIVGAFCEYGPGEPPLVGNWWNLYVLVDFPECDVSPAIARTVEKAALETASC